MWGWMDALTKPATPGVYETSAVDSDENCYQHWNGEFWGAFAFTEDRAYEDRDKKSIFQTVMWLT